MTKKIALLAGVLALAARTAAPDAPSLAEVAKKEAERREKAKKAGTPSRPLTEEDLASAKGTLASTPAGKGSPAPSAAAPGAKDRPGPHVSRMADDPAPEEEARGEAYWRGRAGAARARVEQAQRRLDMLQQMIRYGQPGQLAENGRITIYSAQDMKAMADAAAAALAAAQAELESVLDEGRRAGALPGWLR